MKSLFQYIIIALAGVVLLQACNEPEYDVYGTLYGTVTDEVTKEPVSGAQVTLSPGNLTAVTGSSGSFEFVELEAGQYRLAVSASDYVSDSRQVTVISGERVLCDMQISPVRQESGMELSRTSLDFGTQFDELTFDISNTGNAGALAWSVSNLTVDWATVSPMEGSVAVGKSTSVKVTVDRRLIDRDVSTTFNVDAAGGSQAVRVSVKYDDGSSDDAKMRLSVDRLDFGTDRTELTFDVINDGISEDLVWDISEITVDWMTVTPLSGVTSAGKSSSVKVVVDRSRISEDVTSVITVNADGYSESIEVIVGQAEEEQARMELSVTELDFGTENTELPFEIRNTAGSAAADLEWKISDVTVGWLSFSRDNGTTVAGGQTSVIARVDRSLVTSDTSTVFTVDAGNGQSKSVTVFVGYEGGDVPGGGDEPGGGDNPGEEDYSSATVESGDSRITAEILSCKRSGSSVTLTYVLKNEDLGDINDFRIYTTNSISLISGAYRTVITDENYNSYINSDYTFNGAYQSQNHVLNSTFPEGTGCRGTVTVKNFDLSSEYLTVILGIWCYDLYPDQLADPRIYFENVPVY